MGLGWSLFGILVFMTLLHHSVSVTDILDQGQSNEPDYMHHIKSSAPQQVVHVIFMNHLDVGYNGQIAPGFINFVLNRYFQEFFPRAARLGQALRDGGYEETFIYTTHPWLVSLYLDCPPNFVLSGIKLQCPNKDDLHLFRDAVKKGYISWHAGPMNMMNEYMPRWLVEASLNISLDVDHKLNINRELRVLSQRDVPGMTQAMIPLLLDMQIPVVSVGVNALTAPPAVPRLFRWSYNKREIVAAWHPGGYPNNPGPDPEHPGGLSRKDCLEYQEFPHVLCFAFRTDDTGPPDSIQEIIDNFDILREEYPGANITASTLENYFVNVLPISDKLPLVTKEIGDTWIQGLASDPKKIAEFKTTARILGQCLQQGMCNMTDRRIWNATRFLVKLGEHTWGLDTANDTINWSNQQFYPIRHQSNFQNCTKSWSEQREFTNVAIDALKDHQVAAQIRSGLKNLQANRPDLTGYMAVSGDQSCSGANFTLTVGPDGSITSLKVNGTVWADIGQGRTLSELVYVSYNEGDFLRTDDQYDYIPSAGPGYSKRNITENAHPESQVWRVNKNAAYRHTDTRKCDMWLHLETVDEAPRKFYGAPFDFWVHYMAGTKGSKLVINIELSWFDKPTTRLPEATFLVFKPQTNSSVTTRGHWQYSKLGSIIDPKNVVLNGSQYQHAIDDQGVKYTDQSGRSLQVTSLDVPLVCPITDGIPNPTPFPVPLKPITDNITGFGFNLHNNIWDTNFILWYPYLDIDKDFKSRYQIILS